MKKISFHSLAAAGLVLLVGICAPDTRAATHYVRMESYGFFNFRFVPSSLEIQVGDTVIWQNQDYTQYGYYGYDATCYSSPGVVWWSSGVLYPGEEDGLSFPFAATFNYQDSYFGQYGMRGTLVVKEGSTEPPVPATLVAPEVIPGGYFQCQVSNLVVGRSYVVQASTNLVDWTSLATNTAGTTLEYFVDGRAPGLPRQYYRSWHLP